MPDSTSDPREKAREPYRVRLPGFVSAEDVGLGEAVKRVTRRVGVRPCGGCQRRAAALDSRVVFTRWNR